MSRITRRRSGVERRVGEPHQGGGSPGRSQTASARRPSTRRRSPSTCDAAMPPAPERVNDAFGYASARCASTSTCRRGTRRRLSGHPVRRHGPPPMATTLLQRRREPSSSTKAVRAVGGASWARRDPCRPGGSASRIDTLQDRHRPRPGQSRRSRVCNRDRAATRAPGFATARSWRRRCCAWAAPTRLREFMRWYAPYQAADGNVPCCVDRNGPDWLVEHDSHGQLIFAVMEYYRFTRRSRASSTSCGRPCCKAVDYIEDAARDAPHAGVPRRPRSAPATACCPSRRATRATSRIRCTRTGTTSGPCAGSRTRRASRRVLGDGDARRSGSAALRDGLARDARTPRSTHDRASARSTTCRARSSGPTSIPTATVERDLDARRAARPAARSRSTRTFDDYSTGFRRRRGGEIDWANYTRLRGPHRRRAGAARAPRARRNELLDFFLRDRRPLRVEPVARDLVARSDGAPGTSATCRTPGSAPSTCSSLRSHVRLRARGRSVRW